MRSWIYGVRKAANENNSERLAEWYYSANRVISSKPKAKEAVTAPCWPLFCWWIFWAQRQSLILDSWLVGADDATWSRAIASTNTRSQKGSVYGLVTVLAFQPLPYFASLSEYWRFSTNPKNWKIQAGWFHCPLSYLPLSVILDIASNTTVFRRWR